VFGNSKLNDTNYPPAYLKNVMGFLRDNTNEVLTLLFTNPEGLSLTDVWAPVFVASGTLDFVYIPPHLPTKQSE